MYFRKKISGGRVYLQIAESRRVGGQVRQRVVATLGRLDALQASGQLERLVHSGARFATRALVVTAAKDDPTAAVQRLSAGDPVVLAPAIGRQVRAAAHQPVQHGQEDCRSSANSCLRSRANSSITAWQPVSAHRRSNTRAGPIRRTTAVGSS